MCANNPNKVCDSNGHCGGVCQTNGPSKPIRMILDSIQWVKAINYANLQSLLQQYAGKKIRLMGANTGTGEYYCMCMFHHSMNKSLKSCTSIDAIHKKEDGPNHTVSVNKASSVTMLWTNNERQIAFSTFQLENQLIQMSVANVVQKARERS